MKKNRLLPAALLMSGAVVAQTSVKVPNQKNLLNVSAKTSIHGYANEFANIAAQRPGTNQLRAVTTVGNSTYQLQTNYSVENRIVLNGDGTISAAFTFSNGSGSFTDRGTGYVYYDGTAWSAAPTVRIESARTGWPSLLVLGDNSEVIINHNTAINNLQFEKRAVKGTGAWTENTTIINSIAPNGNFWPRAAVGGATNNSIHLISISNPVDAASAPVYYMGQQGCLTYSRSQDGGATWDILHSVPSQHDSTQYKGFSADSYAIDAKGTTVAYVVGGSTRDLFLMKSLDNGGTWTKTNILNFPIPMFVDQLTDINGDSVIDTLDTNDGSVAVLLDNTGMAHVWYGYMRILNDDSTDAVYSYFPGVAGLYYWNEGMGASAPILVAGLEDIDGDGAITLPGTGAAFGTYQASLTGQPHAGVDAGGKLYVTYAGIVENTDILTTKAARNIYIMTSGDNGVTWSNPVRVNPDDFSDQVYNSMAKNVADPACVKMIYQSDYAAGHGIGATNPDAADNAGVVAEMVYACYNSITGIAETTDLTSIVSLYPNPSNSSINVAAFGLINRYEVYNNRGELVLNGTSNSTSTNVDISKLTSGLYMINVYTNGKRVAKSFVKE